MRRWIALAGDLAGRAMPLYLARADAQVPTQGAGRPLYRARRATHVHGSPWGTRLAIRRGGYCLPRWPHTRRQMAVVRAT